MSTLTVVAPQIPGLGHTHQSTLNALVNQLSAKTPRNKLRRQYYDYKNVLRDLGIAIPPSLTKVETVVGWPAKAVDSMARRTVLDGFTSTEVSTADLGLDALLAANRFDSELPQALTSSLIHAPAFVSVTAGDAASGEPEAMILTRSALSATGMWDSRRRALSSYLSVVSTDDRGVPDHMIMVLPDTAIIMRKSALGPWDLRESRHNLGYVPVEPLPYRPMLDHPFGNSRISRAVMALTDSAVRTLLRTEVSAEFFSAPQRYALGADETAFVDKDGNPIPAWKSIIGRMLAIGLDEEGEKPEVGQFAQHSMEPNFGHMRMLAQQFSAETSLPVGSLGIVQDNPSSAEAIYAAKEDLVIEVQHWERTSLGPALERSMVTALRILDDSPAARAAYAGLRARWHNPSTPSVVSASDAVVKQVAAVPRIGETTVALEKMGYDQTEIERMQAEWRRADGRRLVADLAAAAGESAAPVAVAGGE